MGFWVINHSYGPVLWAGELTQADLVGEGEPGIEAKVTELGTGTQEMTKGANGVWTVTLGTWGNAIVYTPPMYDKNKNKKYPVFYLISGTTDTEEVYFKVGRMNLILDNLIAAGKAKEMIIVLPYGNPSKYFKPGGSRGMSLDDLCPFDSQRKVIEYMLG